MEGEEEGTGLLCYALPWPVPCPSSDYPSLPFPSCVTLLPATMPDGTPQPCPCPALYYCPQCPSETDRNLAPLCLTFPAFLCPYTQPLPLPTPLCLATPNPGPFYLVPCPLCVLFWPFMPFPLPQRPLSHICPQHPPGGGPTACLPPLCPPTSMLTAAHPLLPSPAPLPVTQPSQSSHYSLVSDLGYYRIVFACFCCVNTTTCLRDLTLWCDNIIYLFPFPCLPGCIPIFMGPLC